MADISKLILLATEARDMAHAPYSNHPVGAALVTDAGEIFTGCNVENAAYPLGSCAEQSAIAAMVRGGGKVIAEIAVVGPTRNICTPCGGCRQRIREFATSDTLIHCCNEHEVLLTMTMDEILPECFGPDNICTILK